MLARFAAIGDPDGRSRAVTAHSSAPPGTHGARNHFTRMDATELHTHEAAYHHFTLAVKWAVAHLAAILVFLTLWFATPAGFWWALLAAIVVVGGVVYAMTHGLAHSSEPHPSEHPEELR
jgi:Bacterial aa3 type cytochrome c oxidase subunit IV